VVANKIRSDEDRQAIESFCAQHDMILIGDVPQDQALIEAERQARSPFDYAPDGEAVTAIRSLADAIEGLAGSPSSGAAGEKSALSPAA
jgi:CO dehydrogenase maturation factor